MKTRIGNRILSFVLCIVMLVGMLPATVFAEESSAWIADYTVTATCGCENTMLGTFNGSSACVHSTTGHLHYCSVNFPYSRMASSVYTKFTNDYLWTAEKMAAAMNADKFMSPEDARSILGIYVNADTHTKDETPTLQGVQYFTELTFLQYDGQYMYDGRYNDGDSITSINLSKNTKLQELELLYFSLESIDLSANTALKSIKLAHASESAGSRQTKYNGLKRIKRRSSHWISVKIRN